MAAFPHRTRRALFVAGWTSLAASLCGLVLGLTLVSTLVSDLGATLEVSRAAMESLDETVSVVEDISSDVATSLDAAAEGAEGASTTVDAAVVALDGLAEFLSTDLPDDLESLHQAMPATIRAAAAVDGAVGAISALGIGDARSPGLEESFRQLDEVLGELPGQLRLQGGHVRSLVTPADALSEDVATMAISLQNLRDDLSRFDELSVSYRSTLTEAREAIGQSGDDLGRRALLMRIMVIAVTGAGLALGTALIMAARGTEA